MERKAFMQNFCKYLNNCTHLISSNRNLPQLETSLVQLNLSLVIEAVSVIKLMSLTTCTTLINSHTVHAAYLSSQDEKIECGMWTTLSPFFITDFYVQFFFQASRVSYQCRYDDRWPCYLSHKRYVHGTPWLLIHYTQMK